MHIFGPVPSRRLGKSFVPINDVLQELDRVLKNIPQLDYIIFSGSGEPTLSGIHDMKRALDLAKHFNDALMDGKNIITYGEGNAYNEVIKMWDKLREELL